MPESKYTQALADEICTLLESGQSLNAICQREDMPDERTIRRWALYDEQGFAPKYARAREIGYTRLADEIIEISDEARRDTWVDENGVERTNHEVVARSKLRVDSRKWMLSKVLPKIYGDKLDVNTTGNLTINVVPRAFEPPSK